MLTANIKISVIIPVYNVENYLHECIDSVLNQDYTNLEVILINDGSTDTSGPICNNYAVKDQRVKVLHQENQGVAAARNLGLKYATGDYISFIDSDDWIDQGMYKYFVSNLDRSIDLIYFPPSAHSKLQKAKYDRQTISKEFIRSFIGTPKLETTTKTPVWSLLISRDIITGMEFYNIKMTEDRIFFIEALLKAYTLLVLPKCYYNYRPNSASVSRNYSKDYAHDITFSHQMVSKLLKSYHVKTPILTELHNNTVIRHYYTIIKNEAKGSSDPLKYITEYYEKNDLKELLTWKKTARLVLRNPRWLLIKLGLIIFLINQFQRKQEVVKTYN